MRTDLQLSPWSVSGTGNGWDDDFFESIFFLGNGRMGIRGYIPVEPEDRPIQKGVYLAGIFGEIKPGITDFVNLPTPVYDSILLDGEAGTLSSPIERSLDMKAACFTARFSLTAKQKTVDIVYSRFLPREHPALILQRLKFLPHENVEISVAPFPMTRQKKIRKPFSCPYWWGQALPRRELPQTSRFAEQAFPFGKMCGSAALHFNLPGAKMPVLFIR